MTTLSLKEMNAELDEICFELLNLSQKLIHSKIEMESHMKQGFLCLAKARYSMGSTSVTSLQLPNEDWNDFDAQMKVRKTECLRNNNNVRFNYYSIAEEEGDKSGTIASVKDNQIEDLSSELVKRKGEKEKETTKTEKPLQRKSNDPLKWFGVLVPSTLKQSQHSFKRATEISVECANLQSEISGIEARKKFLLRQKNKLSKETEAES